MITSLRKELQNALGLSSTQLNRLIVRAPYAYKSYEIRKRSGGRRKISQPAKETKYIQYWLIDNILRGLPVHSAATAYASGSSIVKNAEVHKKNTYLAKLDFKEFFPSIKQTHLERHLSKYLSNQINDEDIKMIARVSCIRFEEQKEACLSIGAPSSPLLSNTIMFEFDELMTAWCRERKILYTRYADDLTFSTRERGVSMGIEAAIEAILAELEYPSLSINKNKTILLSRKHQRRITGLIVNNDGDISLGRKRKREISVLIHKFSLKQISEDDSYRLQGLIAFAKDAEPIFVERMRSKYGAEIMSEIFNLRKPEFIIKTLKKNF